MSIILPHQKIVSPAAFKPNTAMQQILDTMRVIAAYRQRFFELEALKQNDGVSPAATASEIVLLEEEQQHLMQHMVTFILYGDKNDKHSRSEQASIENLENDTQKLT